MDPTFTTKQGQYLAYIYCYTKINGKPPAEADMQHYFKVSPPSVHQMVVKLESLGLIEHTSVVVTERYAHLSPDNVRAAVAQLDESMSRFGHADATRG